MSQAPPHDIPMEQAVLGACLIEPSVIPAVKEHILDAEAFYNLGHQMIWKAMMQLEHKRRNIDLLTLSRELDGWWDKEAGQTQLQIVGGVPYLDVLTSAAQSAAHVSSYAQVVANKAAGRRILDCSHELRKLAYADIEPADKAARIIQATERTLVGTIRRGPMTLTQGFVELGTFLSAQRDKREAAQDAGQPYEEHLLGIPTGFRRLDQITGGIVPGMPWLLGGLPGWGKTALALAILRSAANHVHAYFSCADSSVIAMARRVVAHWQGIAIRDVTPATAFGAAHELAEELGDRIYIDDDSDVLIDDVRARVALQKLRDPKLGLWVGDYASSFARSNDWKDVGHVSRVVTRMGRQLKIGTVLLQQLKEEVERRPPEDRRPRAGDISEAAQLRRDARVIIAPYQPARDMKGKYESHDARIYVLKNSDGPAGMHIPVHWDKKTATYSEPPPKTRDVQGSLDPQSALDEISPEDVPL